ncbi:RidA family protein [Pontibacter cellulosilyticus]|uniref:RidA family protein n=1 Tax=Pontibacter cellulosilyticus TaxID=1720253 RepID=A0A923N501_9BACT|nr:RidA family protein [Pontibacter cellulosilyticus]MBC5993015.1 RidA family protein [Pontibacter cellulosilyticus]
MKKLFAILLLLCLALLVEVKAQGILEKNGKVFHLHPGEKEYNYAQAYRSGNMLYISGTVGSGTMDEATERVYKTLELTLKKYGLDFTHVVKENLYTRDMEATKKSIAVRKKYYGTHSPAATWVQIDRLFDEASVLEVELIAEIKKTE